MPIRFFCEEIEFKISNPKKVKDWLRQSASRERREIGEINYVFCSDQYLLKLNQQYLNHKTLTDIITFDYSEGKTVSGEIYMSIERVTENSAKFGCEFEDELHRVMIHGALHLCGYKDKSSSDKTLMRKKEDAYLSLRKKVFHVKRS
ncbi:MAG: rRNA maturation RNase YbeY [Bacteroidetes bacterium]|nr:rRNA maturation RNase YbeY [Bacteroidota bacterium]MBI3482989.1 rRNA maturation RNase YbeY [Bacteroidota bacterium]